MCSDRLELPHTYCSFHHKRNLKKQKKTFLSQVERVRLIGQQGQRRKRQRKKEKVEIVGRHRYVLIVTHEADKSKEENGADAHEKAHDEDSWILVTFTLVRHTENPTRDRQNDGHAFAKEYIENEKNKILLIVRPDAVIDPWTVMIHAEHTAVADTAVVNILVLKLVVAAVAAHFVSKNPLRLRQAVVNNLVFFDFFLRDLVEGSNARVRGHAFDMRPANRHKEELVQTEDGNSR